MFGSSLSGMFAGGAGGNYVGGAVVRLLLDAAQFDRGLTSSQAKMAVWGRRTSQIGGALTRNLTGPLLIAGAASVKLALDFNTAFTKIRANSNLTEKEITRLRKVVLELAGKTGKAPIELANGLYFLASAGLNARQVQETLTMSAKASASGFGEVADIARLTANVLNAYAKEGLKAKKVTDVLAAGIREGTAEPDEFANALGRILPIAQKAGVSFGEIVATLASLSNIGLDVNEGVTAMRGLLSALVAPGSQAAEALKEIGLSADDVRRVISEDGVLGAMRLLEQRTKGNIDVQRKIIPNIRALVAQFGITGQEADKVSAAFRRVIRANGDLDKAFRTTKKDEGFQLQQLIAELQTLAIEVGEEALPVLKDAANVVRDLLKEFNEMPEVLQDNVVKWVIYAAALGPVVRLLSRFITLGSQIGRVVVPALSGGAAAGGAAAGGAAAGAGGVATYTGTLGEIFASSGGAAAAGPGALSGGALAAGLAIPLGLIGAAIFDGFDEKRRAEIREGAVAAGPRTREFNQARSSLGFGNEDLRTINNQIRELRGSTAGRTATIDEENQLQQLLRARAGILNDIRELEHDATDDAINGLEQQITMLGSVNGKLTKQEQHRLDNFIATEKYGKASDLLADALKRETREYSKQLGPIEKIKDGFQKWSESGFAVDDSNRRARRGLELLKDQGTETMLALITAYGSARDAADALLDANQANIDGWVAGAGKVRDLGKDIRDLPKNAKTNFVTPGLSIAVSQTNALRQTLDQLDGRTIGINVGITRTGGSNLSPQAAAQGFDGVVRTPTLFMAGESGAERVSVSPIHRAARGGGTTVVEGDTLIHVDVDVDARGSSLNAAEVRSLVKADIRDALAQAAVHSSRRQRSRNR